MREIDACWFIELEFLNHLHDSGQAHLQPQPVEISVAGFHDCRMQIGLAVMAHATSKLVSDLNATAAR